MENPSFIALSEQTALERHMEVLANNLANMNTPGFKAERLVFAEMVSETSATSIDDMGPISFVEPLSTYMDFSAGEITQTGNPLDVALTGDGFFGVQTANGTGYTRAGRFTLDANGNLVTTDGLPVLAAGGGPISISTDAGPIRIAGDGTISNDDGIVARLQVVRFDDLQELTRNPSGVYTTESQTPIDVTDPQVVQGMVEGSNVSAILEMTRLVDVTRSYERMARMVEAEAKRQENAISTLAKAA